MMHDVGYWISAAFQECPSELYGVCVAVEIWGILKKMSVNDCLEYLQNRKVLLVITESSLPLQIFDMIFMICDVNHPNYNISVSETISL